jgi:hypothetical protein
MRTLLTIVCAGALLAACSDSKRETRTAYDAPRENQTLRPSHNTPSPAAEARPMGDVNSPNGGDRAMVRDQEFGEQGTRPSEAMRVEPARTGDATRAEPDNTRVNERDRDGATATPMDQGGSSTDRAITAEIRKAVVGDDTLSFTAKNVKIITKDGNVVLRGPVKTENERASILAKAQRVAGSERVTNQLEVTK